MAVIEKGREERSVGLDELDELARIIEFNVASARRISQEVRNWASMLQDKARYAMSLLGCGRIRLGRITIEYDPAYDRAVVMLPPDARPEEVERAYKALGAAYHAKWVLDDYELQADLRQYMPEPGRAASSARLLRERLQRFLEEHCLEPLS